jgi:hypothetical protein
MEEITEKNHRLEEAIKLLFRGTIPIVFLAAGVVILALRMPGWSLLLGVPLTIFGAVFLIYTYDEVVRKTFVPMPPEVTKCSVCGKHTPAIPGVPEKDTICAICKRDIKKGMR